jgi:hypothetical protein
MQISRTMMQVSCALEPFRVRFPKWVLSGASTQSCSGLGQSSPLWVAISWFCRFEVGNRWKQGAQRHVVHFVGRELSAVCCGCD